MTIPTSGPRHWFGLIPPETAVAAWGARAISTHNRLDLVWNRQQCDPLCGADDATEEQKQLHRELHAELDSYFLPLVRQRLGRYDPALRGNVSQVTEIKSGRATFRVSPNTSGGYMYMCGWIDGPTEETLPCQSEK